MRRRHLHGLALLLCAGVLFRLLCLSGSLQELARRGPLVDDSFYAFAVARNIAQGRGSTFDGEHLTNGYQPLWMGLLVALYRLAPGELPVRAALWLSVLFNGATALVLWRLLRRRVSPSCALLGVALWAFAPAIVQQAANGLETSMALLCLVLALLHYVERFRPQPTRRHAVILGALLALAVLARVDALLFVLALGFDLVRRRHLWRAAAAVGLVSLAIVGPWCVVSHCFLGASLPESGKAMHLLSAAYAVPSGGATPIPLEMRNLGNSLLLMGTSPALHGFTRAAQRGLQAGGMSSTWQTGATALLLLAGAACAWGLRRAQNRRREEGVGFLVVYAVLLLVAYSLFVFGQIFFARYYYPIFFVSILWACEGFQALLHRSAPRLRRILWLAAVLYVALLPGMAWKRTRHRDVRFLNAVQWLEKSTPIDARVGVFNSGAIGYFSSRRVINLDGKVNHGALQALERDRLSVYLWEERIDTVLDHDRVLERLLLSRPDGGLLDFQHIAGETELGVPGWSAYRVLPAPTAARGRASLLP